MTGQHTSGGKKSILYHMVGVGVVSPPPPPHPNLKLGTCVRKNACTSYLVLCLNIFFIAT